MEPHFLLTLTDTRLSIATRNGEGIKNRLFTLCKPNTSYGDKMPAYAIMSPFTSQVLDIFKKKFNKILKVCQTRCMDLLSPFEIEI